jgi:cytochrome c556
MRVATPIGLLLIGLSITLTVVAAEDPKKSAIHARQGEMFIRAFNAGPLFAMAKGDMPYDAAMAKKLADNLKTLNQVDNGRAWMQGTSNKDYPDDTEALPEIWESDSEIRDKAKDYAKAVDALAAVAGNGREAMGEKVKDLGKACKGCHDDYREDEDK